jgi:putative transposase
MLTYKCELRGIKVIVTEESYTSKCSFLDLEEIKKQENYAGKRVKRGLFKSANGTLINADVNGGYNILRKVFPNAFANGIEGVAVHPVIISQFCENITKKDIV